MPYDPWRAHVFLGEAWRKIPHPWRTMKEDTPFLESHMRSLEIYRGGCAPCISWRAMVSQMCHLCCEVPYDAQDCSKLLRCWICLRSIAWCTTMMVEEPLLSWCETLASLWATMDHNDTSCVLVMLIQYISSMNIPEAAA